MNFLIQLAILVVTTLIAYALAPKPPKPKPPSLDDFEVPTAEAGRAIPVVFGETTVTGPNCVWYGDLEVETETEDGIKRRFYYLGMHFVVCYGPVDHLEKILYGNKIAWGPGSPASTIIDESAVTSSQEISIFASNLHGGEDREGGIAGYFDVMFGDSTQGANAYLIANLGDPQPAYRGVLSVIGKHAYVGTSQYIKPFAFKLKRIKKGWYNDSCWYQEKAEVLSNVGDTPTEPVYTEYSSDTFAVSAVTCPQSGAFDPSSGYHISGVDATDRIVVTITGGYVLAGAGTEGSPYRYYSQYFATSGEQILANTETITQGAAYYNTSGDAVAGLSENPIYLTGETEYWIWINDGGSNADNVGSLTGSVSIQALIGYEDLSGDMNPAHIIYECITNPDWGMGYPASVIDDTNFRAAADTFYNEGMGLSLQWLRQETVEDFVQIILDHCAAVLTVDQSTGKFQLKPLRADYTVGSLPEFDETNIVALEEFERAGYGELVGEVTTVYRDKATNTDQGVTVHNLAVIQSQSGTTSETSQYPGISRQDLAARVAERDLDAKSIPLARGKIRVNREAWSLTPADVFKLSWSKLGLTSVVCRVAEIDYGTLTDGAITITFVEDVFGLPSSSYATEQATLWSDPILTEAENAEFRLDEAGDDRMTENQFYRYTEGT